MHSFTQNASKIFWEGHSPPESIHPYWEEDTPSPDPTSSAPTVPRLRAFGTASTRWNLYPSPNQNLGYALVSKLINYWVPVQRSAFVSFANHLVIPRPLSFRKLTLHFVTRLVISNRTELRHRYYVIGITSWSIMDSRDSNVLFSYRFCFSYC